MAHREESGYDIDSKPTSEAAILMALRGGSHGEALLVERLQTASEESRVIIAAALGEAQGNLGIPVLRSVSANSAASSDVRCAALIALVKRQADQASDIFQALLFDKDDDVRGYALRCLAYAGDGRAWPNVYDLLQRMMSAPPPRFPNALSPSTLLIQSDTLAAVGYLARHLKSAIDESLVVDLIRSKWDRLYTAERRWFDQYWPKCNPTYSEDESQLAPKIQEITAWLGGPLFAPLYNSQ